MRRRDFLLSGAAATLLSQGAAAVDHHRLTDLGGVRATPWVLPTTTLADFAIKGSASAWVDIGNVSIPAGDFTLAFTALVPATASTDFFLFSLGTLSNTILTDSGNLHIGVPGNGSNVAFNNGGWAVSAKDDAAAWCSNKALTLYGANVQAITGPQQNANTPDAQVRNLFLVRKGAQSSLWIIDPGGQTAQQYNVQTTSFGAIAAKPARLGALGKAAVTGFTAISYQRFVRNAAAWTQQQMEAYAASVDPRAISGVSFSAAAGDLLFAFSVAASDGQTYTDLIQGQTATAHGTFASATALLPASVVTDQVRINVQRYQVLQTTGSTTDLTFDGTYTGADGSIELELYNEANGTVQLAYTKIANGSNGKWSGTLSAAIARRIAGFRASVRKKNGAGTVVGQTNFLNFTQFQLGINIVWLGQSLAKQMKTNNNYTPTGAVANACSFWSHGDGVTGTDEAVFPSGFARRTQGGYGEGLISQFVGNTTSAAVGEFNEAKSGSAITDWINDVGGIFTNAIATIKLYKPKYIGWHQGQNSLGDGYAGYMAHLDTLYAMLSAQITWNWKFLILPLDNTYTPSLIPSQWNDIRRAQTDWADGKIAGGDTKVVIAGTVNDMPTTGMNPDGEHALAAASGYGYHAERVSRTINFSEGIEADSGLGPRLVSAAWTGAAAFVDVALVHNGGTDIQTPNVANITGFDASIDGFATILSQASCLRLDATHIRITLSSTPASAPAIRYQYGQPGASTTTAANGLSNPVYDNRTPYLNTTLGFPVMFTPSPIQSV